jgi:hypothetical protein
MECKNSNEHAFTNTMALNMIEINSANFLFPFHIAVVSQTRYNRTKTITSLRNGHTCVSSIANSIIYDYSGQQVSEIKDCLGVFELHNQYQAHIMKYSGIHIVKGTKVVQKLIFLFADVLTFIELNDRQLACVIIDEDTQIGDELYVLYVWKYVNGEYTLNRKIMNIYDALQLKDGRFITLSATHRNNVTFWNVDTMTVISHVDTRYFGTGSLCRHRQLNQLNETHLLVGLVGFNELYDISNDESMLYVEYLHLNNCSKVISLDAGYILISDLDFTFVKNNIYMYHLPTKVRTLIGSSIQDMTVIYTPSDCMVGQQRLFAFLQDLIVQDVKQIVFQYLCPL